MKNPAYLGLSSHHVYYFRYPFPATLHPQGKVCFIKLSLGTRCPQMALRFSRCLITLAESILSNPAVLGMDFIELRELLISHFKAKREAIKEQINKHGRLTMQEQLVYKSQIETATKALEQGDYSQVATQDDVAAFIKAYDLPITKEDTQFASLSEEYTRAMLGYAESILNYNKRLETFKFTTDPSFFGINQATAETRKKKLGDYLPQYVEEKMRGKEWNAKFAGEADSYFRLLLEYLGKDAPLYISPETANNVKHMLMQIPKFVRSSETLKRMTLQEIIALPSNDPLKQGKLLNNASIRKYLTTYSGFYEWAVKHKHTSDNNFKDINVKIDKKRKKSEFSPEQIEAIVNAVISEQKPQYKWGALILRYTGARLEEIAQMRVADVKQEDGIWYFDIEETLDEAESKLHPKKLKNQASRRRVPVHSKLIELGLLNYIDTAKGKGDGRILHQLTYVKNNGYGRNLGRWFNEALLKKLGIKTPHLSLHSLRHTAITDMLRNGVADAIAKTVVGHTVEGVAHENYFGGYTLAQLQDAVEKIG